MNSGEIDENIVLDVIDLCWNMQCMIPPPSTLQLATKYCNLVHVDYWRNTCWSSESNKTVDTERTDQYSLGCRGYPVEPNSMDFDPHHYKGSSLLPALLSSQYPPPPLALITSLSCVTWSSIASYLSCCTLIFLL